MPSVVNAEQTPVSKATVDPTNVTIVDNGTTVTIQNLLVSVTITKASAGISTYMYAGQNILSGGYSGGSF